MQPISPISEAAIHSYIGKQVCAVLHDGTHLYGTITDCREGQLFLSGGVKGPGTVSTSAIRAKAQIRTKLKNKAKISAFTPFFGFGGGAAAAAISLALIASLFFFPFGFGFPFFF
ncbi:hypothetical protein [Cohnella luojiensis]|uniref:Uncharacterized protein n=1 Tax=Cohnella luojiensis TaxID=652876 RepID=A0A4Y8LP98_9BACL|nr:hypothetical protein [Cohnella luojiensis]TFE19530.1 hypothetical protein E2980_22855 [Cohnella luojiensis]